jgi:hypothetical protein
MWKDRRDLGRPVLASRRGRVGRDLSPLVVHRHTDDLSGVRRRWLLQGTEVGRRKENGHAN